MINCYQFYKMDPETERADPEKLISEVDVVASGRQDASEAGASLSPPAGSGQVLTAAEDEAVDPSAEPKREVVRPMRRLTVKTNMASLSLSASSAATSKVRSGDATPPLTPTRRSRVEASGETGTTAGPNPEVDEEVPVPSRRRLDAGVGASAPSVAVRRPGFTCDLREVESGAVPTAPDMPSGEPGRFTNAGVNLREIEVESVQFILQWRQVASVRLWRRRGPCRSLILEARTNSSQLARIRLPIGTRKM